MGKPDVRNLRGGAGNVAYGRARQRSTRLGSEAGRPPPGLMALFRPRPLRSSREDPPARRTFGPLRGPTIDFLEQSGIKTPSDQAATVKGPLRGGGSTSSRCADPRSRCGPAGDLLPPRNARVVRAGSLLPAR